MEKKYIGFPMKDGCHVNGANMGIEVLKKNTNIDIIIDVNENDNDILGVSKYDNMLAKSVSDVIKNGCMPIILGGDHSLAMGSIAGSSENYELGVIWFDTHPDCNTNETTETFNIHGYPLAASMGFGMDTFTKLYNDNVKVDYHNVVMFGIDDIDEAEKILIEKYNIRNYPLEMINEKGIDFCINDAINYLNERVKNIHLSFDIDVIKTEDCPGVNVPNRWNRGINKTDALKAVNSFYNNLNIVSMDIVEYNPLTDIDNKSLNIVLDTIKIIENKTNQY